VCNGSVAAVRIHPNYRCPVIADLLAGYQRNPKGNEKMSNALSIYNQFDQIKGAAIALQKSGFFKDVSSEAQAIVKVMAGAELGLPPFASMTGISIIQGKPVLGANLIATLIKNDPRYDYRVKVATNESCLIEFFENGNSSGETGFTIQEAQAAGLTNKDNWKKYPSDMLFARAISRGAKRHSPGIFGGSPVYTADEMGVDVDPDGYVEAQFVEDAGQTDPQKDPAWNPAQHSNAKPPAQDFTVYDAVVEAGLAENEFSAKNALKKCATGYDTAEKAIAWMRKYRAARDQGNDSTEAAAIANGN